MVTDKQFGGRSIGDGVCRNSVCSFRDIVCLSAILVDLVTSAAYLLLLQSEL